MVIQTWESAYLPWVGNTSSGFVSAVRSFACGLWGEVRHLCRACPLSEAPLPSIFLLVSKGYKLGPGREAGSHPMALSESAKLVCLFGFPEQRPGKREQGFLRKLRQVFYWDVGSQLYQQGALESPSGKPNSTSK